MKIGIITHHYIKNYGAFLQAYALQETLTNLYPEARVEIINYINKEHYYSNLRPFIISKPRSRKIVKSIRISIDDKKQLMQYYKVKKSLNISARCKNVEDINSMKYDAIFIGSDEVWNFNAVGADPVKFSVGLTCENIFSYAPSAGNIKKGKEFPTYVYEGMNNFKKISVRDKQTREFAESIYLGEIENVLDPTFLYDFEKEVNSTRIRSLPSYILVYQCDLEKSQINLIKDFSRKNKLIIVGAGCHKDWFDKSLIDINPFEWAQLFKQSQYVVTGTFHGTIFAIKSKAKFVAYPTFSNRIEKIKSLLNQFGIESQLLNEGNKNEICNKIVNDLNYDIIDQKIDELKEESIKFIKDCVIQ